ncbi:MAG TPA: lipopolysaccharide heptosyltransferase II [Pyrinomonadaceae bacterium]|nr:lipopolysaccharide heptosyltransferase II [Pyrinomonadaceae bacterium]
MSDQRIHSERIERVVVRGANWVGDAVMTVPALRELRRALPGAHITLAMRAWAVGVFDGADFLDEVMILDSERRGLRGRLSEVREWRRRRFDLAVLFPNAFAPALVAWAARVPRRIGYDTERRGTLLTHALHVPDWRGKRHEVFYYLNIIAKIERSMGGESSPAPAPLAGADLPAPRLNLEISFERRQAAREILMQHGVLFDRPLVALCPGSTNSRAKRWPPERFAALADQLIDDAGAGVVLIGSREEMDVTAEVVGHMTRRPVVLTGKTSLAETIAVLSHADLLITNDTGPAHIAAALNLPTLVIFGPTDPTTTRPFSASAEVIRRPPECAPCMLRVCPIDHRCMTAITPAEVYARARQIVGERVSVGAAR